MNLDQASTVEKVFELFEVDEKIKDVDNPIQANISKGEIEFKNVTFSYDKKESGKERKNCVTDLSFKIPAGKSVGIVGCTGSGKSTLMRLLYRFWDVDQGQILIDGQDISQMKVDDLRSKIAMVPQDCCLFNDILFYNIAYGGIKDSSIKEHIDEKKIFHHDTKNKVEDAA